MARLSLGMYLCFCIVKIALWKEVNGKEGSNKASCSCYFFADQPASRHASKFLCKEGYLASMETIEEWEFIKTEIQNRTASEWWIGLEKKEENWTWLSNHSLTYDKWLRGKPHDNNAKKFATIVKELNGTQGLFNKTDNQERGRICEYTSTNCSEEKVRWCGSGTSTPHPSSRNPTPLSPPVNAKGGWNDTGPRHPIECAVIKKQNTPVVIPILVALAGLVVIVAINIIIVKWRNTTRESSKKRDKSLSEQESMNPADGTTIDMDAPGSGIKAKENLQPREECIGNSGTNLDEGMNDTIGIDASCGNTAKTEQPYYVNVQGSTQQNTLQVTDTNGHYASVGDINETDGQKDSFVVVRTYSIVRNDDDDGQTEDSNTANYATVSDTLGTDRQTVTLVTSESGYASVDVINNNSQKGPSISGHHDDPTNAPHNGTAQYAVIDKQKKNSKKDKTKQADNQNNTQDSSAPDEVIYDNCRDVPFVQEQQGSTQHTLADNAGATVEYAAVNKSMKKKNRSVKEAAQPSTPAEASYACVDVKYCQEVPPVQGQRGSRRKKNTEEHAQADVSTSGTAQAVDKSKKRNRSVKNASKPSKPTEASYACVDLEGCQDGVPMEGQRESRRKKNTEEHAQADVSTSGTAQVEYLAVDKSKKRKRSVKNASKPSKPTEASYACVDLEGCQDGVPMEGQRGSSRKKNAEEHAQADVSTSGTAQVEYAAVDKNKKRNKSVKNASNSSKPTEASYACVDLEGFQEGAPAQGQRGSRRKKENEQHTLAENIPNTGKKVEYAEVDKTKKTNRSVKEVANPIEPTESSYASVDVIYDNC